ncbi:hypothetical protein EBB07_00680 [Paenibacillaceae bacterium]|nr:hypothetical protein EBB07_00680 [Paenibacillaceae bacterium]
MNEITIRKVRYQLPEGFTSVGRDIYDETGRICSLFLGGYRVGDDRPYVMTFWQQSHPLRRIEPVEVSNDSGVNNAYAWELSMKLLKMLMDGGKLAEDYEEKLKIVDSEFEKFGDEALKVHVLSRIDAVIKEYKKSRVWDYTLLGK